MCKIKKKIFQIAVFETRSNLNYLQILKESCLKLYSVNDLNDVMKMIPDILFKFIFILKESPYYNQV